MTVSPSGGYSAAVLGSDTCGGSISAGSYSATLSGNCTAGVQFNAVSSSGRRSKINGSTINHCWISGQ
jgi:hypothetical protein